MSGKRSIFEDVDSAEKPAAVPGALERGQGRGRGFARAWLMVLFTLVVAMIMVGGLTRLTDSGLSITEWAPFSGAMPPITAEDWQAEFAAYQQSPEFRLQNSAMVLEDFKYIFWWEWSHRQLGRILGLIWFGGFAFMAVSGRIPRGWTGRFVLVGVLGGSQGALGWWMVSSGLRDGMLDVASYRLAMHLGLAFFILGLIAWYAFRLGRDEADLLAARRSTDKGLKRWSTELLHLGFLQVIVGALVAGIDAGRNFPDWPLMAGGFFPPDMWVFDPFWRNFFENDGTVQFFHRIIGYLLAALAVAAIVMARRSGKIASRRALQLAGAMVLVQAVLGIVTLMNSSPLSLAIIHQLGAVVTIVLILRARFLAIYPVMQTVRRGQAK
jgi:heme a synthase